MPRIEHIPRTLPQRALPLQGGGVPASTGARGIARRDLVAVERQTPAITRIMNQVQSTWFPFVDRNRQSWAPNIFAATEADFIKVTNSVHRSREHPSGVRVAVLP